MTRIFYSFIIAGIICLYATPVHGGTHLQITERTKEKVIVAFDSTIETGSFKVYDLFRVYEKKVTENDET